MNALKLHLSQLYCSLMKNEQWNSLHILQNARCSSPRSMFVYIVKMNVFSSSFSLSILKEIFWNFLEAMYLASSLQPFKYASFSELADILKLFILHESNIPTPLYLMQLAFKFKIARLAALSTSSLNLFPECPFTLCIFIFKRLFF